MPVGWASCVAEATLINGVNADIHQSEESKSQNEIVPWEIIPERPNIQS